MDIDKVPSLAEAASTIGPDFYAVILMMVVVSTAATLSWRADKRVPPLTDEQKAPYRRFFTVSWVFSFFVVMISISHWIYKENNTHVVQITIADLPNNISIDSRYFNKISYRHSAIDNEVLKDYHYLVVRGSSFKKGDFFEFSVYITAGVDNASGGLASELKIKFDGGNKYSYRLKMDTAGKPNLEPIAKVESLAPLFKRSDLAVTYVNVGGSYHETF